MVTLDRNILFAAPRLRAIPSTVSSRIYRRFQKLDVIPLSFTRLLDRSWPTTHGGTVLIGRGAGTLQSLNRELARISLMQFMILHRFDQCRITAKLSRIDGPMALKVPNR